MMASFNILKAITVFTGKKGRRFGKSRSPGVEPSEANGGKKKYK